MADIFIIHRNDVFNRPVAFTVEAEAQKVIQAFANRGETWILRQSPIFPDAQAFAAARLAIIRERALAKLTDEEKQALGLA